MENNENNNLNELDQLKAQYETLKQQFDQQEIVNDRLMKSVIQASTGFFGKYRKSIIIGYPILAILGFVFLAHFGYSWSLGVGFVLLMAISTLVELWLTRNVRQQVVENSDLFTLSKNMQKLKTGYAIYVVLLLIVGFLFLALFCFFTIITPHAASVGPAVIYRFLWTVCISGVSMLLMAILVYYYFASHCNNVLRQIDAIDGTQRARNNRSFWCFLGSVALMCAIAFVLVTGWFNPTNHYRAKGDLSSEGKLEIWEIYADTTVLEKDAPIFLERWQNNDSLVLMKGNGRQVTMEIDGISVHSHKREEGGQVKLYALKKTTPEGPAISSAVLGGKPVVERATHGPKYSNRRPAQYGVFVDMTPEAAQLWSEFTRKAANSPGTNRAAFCLDGVVYQEWTIVGEVASSSFFVMNVWTKDDVKAFCKRIVKQ